jgi:hypothetical protein
VSQHPGIDSCGVTVRSCRNLHDIVFVEARNKIFSGGNVFQAFGDGPFAWSGLEIPLRFGQAFGGLQNAFLAVFEYGDGLVFFGPGDVLRESRTRCGKRGEDDFALGR